MMRRLILALAISALIAAPAAAHPHHHGFHPRYKASWSHRAARRVHPARSWRQSHQSSQEPSWSSYGAPWSQPSYSQSAPNGFRSDPRPLQWCAWWLRKVLHIPLGIINNTALSFEHYGHVTSPHQGAVVIWSHGHGRGHVGQITGGQCGPNSWVVTSGNDGNRVRTRCRYVGNAIGFREG